MKSRRSSRGRCEGPVIFSRKAILLGGAHQTSGEPDLKLICPVSRHGCRMPRLSDATVVGCHGCRRPRNNRYSKKLRFFCDDDAGTGTSSMLKHDPPRASNVGAQHITYQHIMPSPLLPKPEGRMRNKLIIKRLSNTEK